MIDDTPRQTGNPSVSCAQGKGTDSCPALPGLDDISNYMGAYFDSCRDHFTPGQVTFMHNTIAALKPSLMAQIPPGCVAAVDDTDHSADLRPCYSEVFTDTTHSTEARAWCYTDRFDDTIWGWACCPLVDGSPDPSCRTGSFSTTTNGAGGGQPLSVQTYPTSPPVQPWIPPIVTQGAAIPTTAPVVPAPGPPTSPAVTCVYQGCQDAFYLPTGKKKKMVLYQEPVSMSMYRPYQSSSYAKTVLWCPLNGVQQYNAKSPSVQALWKVATCS